MPGRKHPFIVGSIYHVFNKTIEGRKIFNEDEKCQKFLEICRYYRSSQSIMRFSNFIRLSPDFIQLYEERISDKRTFRVSVLAYCFMPTHYHFLLRQNHEKGISIFISQVQNSFTRYSNIKHERIGPIFLHRFKSKPIQSEEQLKHVARYIHLNPYSSGVVQNHEDLQNFPWSSFHEYINSLSPKISEPNFILTLFNNNKERYKKFVLDNAYHQKMLENCKYLNRW